MSGDLGVPQVSGLENRRMALGSVIRLNGEYREETCAVCGSNLGDHCGGYQEFVRRAFQVIVWTVPVM